MTPHIAGFSPVFLGECPIRQAENVIRVLTGKMPHGIANPEAIKTIAVMRAQRPGALGGSAGLLGPRWRCSQALEPRGGTR